MFWPDFELKQLHLQLLPIHILIVALCFHCVVFLYCVGKLLVSFVSEKSKIEAEEAIVLVARYKGTN